MNQAHDGLCSISQRRGDVCDCYLSRIPPGTTTASATKQDFESWFLEKLFAGLVYDADRDMPKMGWDAALLSAYEAKGRHDP